MAVGVRLLCLVWTAAVGVGAAPASAAGSLVKLLDTEAPIPSPVGGTFVEIWEAGVHADTVVFLGIGADNQRGVYAVVDGEVVTVADQSVIQPGFGVPFQGFEFSGHTIDETGAALFKGRSSFSAQGLYTWTPEAGLGVFIDTETVVEGGKINFVAHPSRRGGVTAFLGGNFESGGIFSDVFGEIGVLVDDDGPAPGNRGAQFLNIQRQRHDGSTIVFKASSFGGPVSRGFYLLRNGSLGVLADQNTALPGEDDVFFDPSPFLRTACDVEGDVAVFVADSTESDFGGVYRADLASGEITVIADGRTPAPHLPGVTLGDVGGQIGAEVSMRNGIVVFTTQEGVYADTPAGLIRVVGAEDVAEGGLDLVNLAIGPDGFDGESIVFRSRFFADFPDFFEALWRVDLFPPRGCDGDLDGDGGVDVDDLNLLLGAFGVFPSGDLDGDKDTDAVDLNLLLNAFGEACGPSPELARRTSARPWAASG